MGANNRCDEQTLIWTDRLDMVRQWSLEENVFDA